MRTSRGGALLLLLLGLVGAGSVSASWMREYDRGLQAVKQEDWAEAEQRFAAAIREDPVPQDWRRFQGAVFRPYVPHYYAGLAAWRRGDCQTAMQYWSHPATVSELGKPRLQEERAEHQRGVSACQSRLAQAEAPKPAPTPAQAPAVASTSTPPPSSTPSRPAQTTPTRPAPSAATPSSSTASPSVAANPPPATRPQPPPASRPAQAPAAASAPTALREAVQAWLGGNYTELLRTQVGNGGDARSRAQLHLFRAAAAYVLAEQAGQAEGSGLDNARQEVRAARAAQSGLQPDEVLFSPRFRSFWQQTR